MWKYSFRDNCKRRLNMRYYISKKKKEGKFSSRFECRIEKKYFYSSNRTKRRSNFSRSLLEIYSISNADTCVKEFTFLLHSNRFICIRLDRSQSK